MDIKAKIEKALIESEQILNQTHKESSSQSFLSPEHRMFCLLKMQAALFHFEICSGMAELIKIQNYSFAKKAKLKDLIHKVFEYKRTLKRNHIKKVMELAESKHLANEKALISEVTKKYRMAIKNIEKYKTLRNSATGHYDQDIQKQISYINDINEDEALELILAFLSYDKEITELLKKIGMKT